MSLGLDEAKAVEPTVAMKNRGNPQPKASTRNRFAAYANISIRGGTLLLRFLLVFYVAHYLGFEATGVYGLAVGAVGIIPAAVGWGLNYFVAREVVGIDRRDAVLIVRDRLLITTVSLAGLTTLAFVASGLGLIRVDALTAMIIALVWLETYALDIHIGLIGMELAVLANVLMFIRSASWVIPLLAVGILMPQFRSLEAVFGFWIAGHALTIVALHVLVRRNSIKYWAERVPDFAWMRAKLSRSWLIYASDIGIVGFIYLDRYVIGYLLGLTDTGIYTFYWSITNALQTLIATAVVQTALPAVVKAFRTGWTEWRSTLLRELARTVAFSGVLSVLIFAGCMVAFWLAIIPQHGNSPVLFAALLLASIIRSCSDILNVGLSSTTRDKSYAAINILGVPVSLVFTVTFVSLFGLMGAGVSAVISALVLVGVRSAMLLRLYRLGGGEHARAR